METCVVIKHSVRPTSIFLKIRPDDQRDALFTTSNAELRLEALISTLSSAGETNAKSSSSTATSEMLRPRIAWAVVDRSGNLDSC